LYNCTPQLSEKEAAKEKTEQSKRHEERLAAIEAERAKAAASAVVENDRLKKALAQQKQVKEARHPPRAF
jgi:guanylate kinase